MDVQIDGQGYILVHLCDNGNQKSNVIGALYSSVEASLHCHHQLTFSVGEICPPVITKVNITVTTQQSLVTIMQHLGSLIY